MNLRESAPYALTLAMACVLGWLVDRQLHLDEAPPLPSASRNGSAASDSTSHQLPSDSLARGSQQNEGNGNAPESREEIGRAVGELRMEKNPRRRIRKMNALVDALDAGEIAGVLGSLTAQKRLYLTEKDRSLAVALVERWAATDPEAAFAYIQSNVSYAQRADLLEAAAASWASDQPKAALDWLSSVPNGELRRGVLSGIVTSAGQVDPAAALQYIASLPGYEQLSLATAQGDIFKAWATHDPQAAASRALALPPGSGVALRAVAMAWADTDAPAAMAWIEQIPNANVRSTTFGETFESWAKKDQQAAADYVLTVPAGETRDDAIIVAMRELAAHSGEAALEFFQKLPVGMGRDAAAKELASEMVSYDPHGAVAFVETLPPGQARDDASENLARRWATSDIAAAMTWARSLPGENKTLALRSVLYGWSNDDPPAAATYLLSQSSAQEHQEILTAIALSESSPEQGIVWAEQTKDPQKRTELLENLCRKWVQMDLDAAVQWIEKSTLISQKTKSTLLGSVR